MRLEKQPQSTVAYILKGFGRTSETFITNEIYLLESFGLRLKIFSIKQLAQQKQHDVIARIQASINYLPPTTPFEFANFFGWLYFNLPGFLPSHTQLLRRHPLAWLATLLECLWMSCKYRKGILALPRKVFIKEFLQAGHIAASILAAPEVRHIHAHFAHGSTTIAMFASRLSGLPFSFTGHAKDIYLAELNPDDLLDKKMRRAKFVVTCTEANKTHLKARNRPHQTPIHVIYHGIDTNLFQPHFPRLAPTTPLLLSVGRMVEKKGFTYLVEACRYLRDWGYDFRCHIIGGEDNHTAVIKEKIAHLELQGIVTLHHAVTQQELAKIYKSGTLFALPCQIIDNGDRDGIPNVLVEAMAMGLPVVSTNISGIPELVKDGHNGLLVEQKDALAFAKAISKLLGDAALRERLAQAGRVSVCEKFDAQRNTITLQSLFMQQLRCATETEQGLTNHATASNDEHLSQPV